MTVAMMEVAHVRMCVRQSVVAVVVRVRLDDVDPWRMLVLVMLIMNVEVLVREWFVRVLVVVPFGQDERNTGGHHGAGRELTYTDRFGEQGDRHCGTYEGSGGEDGRFPRRP